MPASAKSAIVGLVGLPKICSFNKVLAELSAGCFEKFFS